MDMVDIDKRLSMLTRARRGEKLCRLEIAKFTGLSVGQVRRYEQSALKKLHKELKGII